MNVALSCFSNNSRFSFNAKLIYGKGGTERPPLRLEDQVKKSLASLGVKTVINLPRKERSGWQLFIRSEHIYLLETGYTTQFKLQQGLHIKLGLL